MSIKTTNTNNALSGITSDQLLAANNPVPTVPNKNFWHHPTNRPLTLIISTLELPLKKFRKMERNLSQINATSSP